MMPDDDDALSAAIEELYSLDPAEFTQRRGALARQARRDGDATSAGTISRLRRPTKAAWLINRLVRSQPEVASGLCELAAQLRDAQRSLDGGRLRQLTQQRRKLIDAATRQAFDLAKQPEPTAALRHEVSSTLEAALADPEIATQLSSGTLERSAQWSGFGESAPTLSAVPTPQQVRRPARAPAKRTAARTPSASTSPAPNSATSATASAEQRRRERVTQAEAALASASGDVQAAAAVEREQADTVGALTQQLAHARRRLDEARLDTRRADARHCEAQRGLDRARR